MEALLKRQRWLSLALLAALVLLSLTGCAAARLSAAGLPGAQSAGFACDLTVPDAFCAAGDALFRQGTLPDPSGTGALDVFLRLGGDEAAARPQIRGYNSDYRPAQFDAAAGKALNRALWLSEVPTVFVNGSLYREFALDLNQSGCDARSRAGCLLSLDRLRVYASANRALRDYDPAAGRFSGAADLLYSLESAPLTLDAALVGSSSGRSDLFFYLPERLFRDFAGCAYGAQRCRTAIALYAEFGAAHANTGGPEQWAVAGPANGRGTLVVTHAAAPADGTDFSYWLSGGPEALGAGFKLDDAAPGDGDSVPGAVGLSLPAGAYRLAQNTPPGWRKTRRRAGKRPPTAATAASRSRPARWPSTPAT